jgi:hypothetical protein
VMMKRAGDTGAACRPPTVAGMAVGRRANVRGVPWVNTAKDQRNPTTGSKAMRAVRTRTN